MKSLSKIICRLAHKTSKVLTGLNLRVLRKFLVINSLRSWYIKMIDQILLYVCTILYAFNQDWYAILIYYSSLTNVDSIVHAFCKSVVDQLEICIFYVYIWYMLYAYTKNLHGNHNEILNSIFKLINCAPHIDLILFTTISPEVVFYRFCRFSCKISTEDHINVSPSIAKLTATIYDL